MSIPRSVPLDGDDWSLYWLHPNEWLWRRVWEREPPEAASRRIPAAVPGHSLDALLAARGEAGSLPHPYVGLNSREWEWTSERDWIYEKRFPTPEGGPGARYHLRFEGIDDAAHVYLNGRHVGDHEGEFVPAEWEVTDLLAAEGENRLLVVVEHAPEVQGQIGYTSRERRWKSRFAYGWDWCTRLVPVGLWDSVRLDVTGPGRLLSAAVHTNLSLDRAEAALSLVLELEAMVEARATIVTEITQAGLPVATVRDPITLFPGGTTLVQSATLPRVQLWWPNGHGRQPLYEARITVLDADARPMDRRTVEFGVREVAASPCDGAPPDSLPYRISVNGRPIWLKGWNWAPVDQLYGSAPAERYDRLLTLAREAGVTMLRVWGGGVLEKEAFYRLCDRYGIMVWQEFPLSSSGIDNEPPSDPAYLAYIRRQAEAMLQRRRNHPSLVLWCGGNELTDSDYRPLGSDHPALAELRSAVASEDPQRLWLPTSPSGPWFAADPKRKGELHDVHGHWLWMGLREQPAFYNGIDPLLHSEYGCEGAARPELLRLLFDGDVPFPSRADPVWMHHGGNWWLQPEAVEKAFGPIGDLETWIRASQAIQAIGLQYATEANRRRKWRCAGTLPWQLNEPWPNATGTYAVDYLGEPKPAYYAMKRAYRPLHVSALLPTFAWGGEEEFRAEVWLHNSGSARDLLNVVAIVADLHGRELYQESLAGEAPENAAECVGDLSWRFPEGFEGAFLLLLEVVDEEGETVARNAYLHSRREPAPFAPFLSAPRARLETEHTPDGLRIRNAGGAAAIGVSVEAAGALIEDSDFPLLPGAAREIAVRGALEPPRVACWNQD